MAKSLVNLLNFPVLLLLLLMPTANSSKHTKNLNSSMDDIMPGARLAPHGGRKDTQVIHKKPVPPTGQNIQDEIRAVDGNILAYSIVQRTKNQAKTMVVMQQWLMRRNNAKLKEQAEPVFQMKMLEMLEKANLTDKQKEMLKKQGAKPGFWIKMLEKAKLTKEQAEMLKSEEGKQAFLTKLLNNPNWLNEGMKITAKHEFWLKMFKDSKLTDAQMAMLKDELAGALMDEGKRKEYLAKLKNILQEYGTKLEALELPEEIKENVFFLQQQDGTAEKPVNLHDIVHQLRTESVNFMEQIGFEVKLYYNFSNQLQPAFEENNKNMEKLKEEKLAEYNYEAKGAERQMTQMEYGELRERRQFELIKKAGARYHESVRIINSLMDLNNMAENLYKEIVAVIKMPLHNREKFAVSILEVAQMASEEGSENANANNLLKKLIYIWGDAQLISHKLPVKWHTDIYGQIRKKAEMPTDWYLDMEAEAYPKGVDEENKLTVEIVAMRIQLVLAKTLLAYVRLDAFYKIEQIYKEWKLIKDSPGTEEGLPKSYFLVNSHFERVEKEHNDEKLRLAALHNDEQKA